MASYLLFLGTDGGPPSSIQMCFDSSSSPTTMTLPSLDEYGNNLAPLTTLLSLSTDTNMYVDLWTVDYAFVGTYAIDVSTESTSGNNSTYNITNHKQVSSMPLADGSVQLMVTLRGY